MRHPVRIVVLMLAVLGVAAPSASAAKLRGSMSGLRTAVSLDDSGNPTRVDFTFSTRCDDNGSFKDGIYVQLTEPSFKDTFDYTIRQRGGITARVHTTSSGAMRTPFRWTGRFAMSAVIRQHGHVIAHCRLPTRNWSATTPQIKIDMTSDSGDYIGQGQAYTWATPQDDIWVGGNRRQINALAGGYDFTFSPPEGETLKPGMTYADGQRAPFAGDHTGIEVSGNGRGCNTISGQFTVNAVEFTKGGKLAKLDMAFEQHCEGGPAALRGTITYVMQPN
jgi:hypothetical protein